MGPLRAVAAVLAAVAILANASPAAAAAPSATNYWTTTPGWAHLIVEDHTAGAWPVARAVAMWGSGLTLGTCNYRHGCIRVFNERISADYDGLTTWHAADNIYHRKVRIVLNARYRNSDTARERYEATLHELGHSLGLNHDTTGGCMYPVNNGLHAYVSSGERAVLRRAYGVS